ncbi:hypothetical protein QR721_12775 [Aciduricibacillus chroicocephali]|uniref:Uncharacterized protein n=1 Tax=Aciduricibacillus chroicocephali TaxID=3054939 RepID=A0ABY9KVA2_9BACI|nr:hypothetical protein QR721_12775 [Bacillaceae bacterium 44XB]
MKGRLVFLVFFFAFAMSFNGQAEAAEKEEPAPERAKPVGGLIKGITGTATKTVDHTVETTSNVVKETTSDVTETVDQTVGGVTHVVKETGTAVTNAVRETTEQTSKSSAVKPVTDTVNKVTSPVLDTVDQTVSATVDTVGDTTEATKEVVSAATNAVQETTSGVTVGVDETVATTTNVVKGTGVAATDTVRKTTEQLEKVPVAKPVTKNVNKVVEPVLGTVDETVSITADTLNDTVGEVTNTVDKTVGTTGTLIDHVGSEAGNTVGTAVAQTAETADQVSAPIKEALKPEIGKPLIPGKQPEASAEESVISQPHSSVGENPQKPELPSGETQDMEQPLVDMNSEQVSDNKQPATVLKPVLKPEEDQANGLELREQSRQESLQPELVTVHQINHNPSDIEKTFPLISIAKQKQPEKQAFTDFIKELTGLQANFVQKLFKDEGISIFNAKMETPQQQDSQLKELERLYIAQPPVQPQQSATVIYSGFGAGLAAVLGEIPVRRNLLDQDRWMNSTDHLINQWAIAPPGQPPKFSPFLLSRI